MLRPKSTSNRKVLIAIFSKDILNPTHLTTTTLANCVQTPSSPIWTHAQVSLLVCLFSCPRQTTSVSNIKQVMVLPHSKSQWLLIRCRAGPGSVAPDHVSGFISYPSLLTCSLFFQPHWSLCCTSNILLHPCLRVSEMAIYATWRILPWGSHMAFLPAFFNFLFKCHLLKAAFPNHSRWNQAPCTVCLISLLCLYNSDTTLYLYLFAYYPILSLKCKTQSQRLCLVSCCTSSIESYAWFIPDKYVCGMNYQIKNEWISNFTNISHEYVSSPHTKK